MLCRCSLFFITLVHFCSLSWAARRRLDHAMKTEDVISSFIICSESKSTVIYKHTHLLAKLDSNNVNILAETSMYYTMFLNYIVMLYSFCNIACTYIYCIIKFFVSMFIFFY